MTAATFDVERIRRSKVERGRVMRAARSGDRETRAAAAEALAEADDDGED